MRRSSAAFRRRNLIERHKVTADEAFRLLSQASQHTNRKLRDLAEDLVLTGEFAH